jgi:hypothetical protein
VNAVSASVKRTLCHHLGTIAFGAFIIAVIQFVRAILTYIELKTRKRQNFAVRCAFACVACCLRCMQTCMDRINKNAFIWVTSFRIIHTLTHLVACLVSHRPLYGVTRLSSPRVLPSH